MKQLQALLYKEWRDQRTLVVCGIAASVALAGLARLLGASGPDSAQNAHFAIRVCEWSFALALAVETITRDVAHGVESSFLRLPVPRQLAWRAKVVFVVLACALLHFALVLGELAAQLLGHGSPLEAVRGMFQPADWLFGGVLATAAFASACTLRRSLPAAVVGLVFVVGIPAVAARLADGRTREWLDVLLNSWTRTAFAAIACIAFLIGSFLAFRVRRADPTGLRRASALAFGIGLVLVPVFAGTASASSWAFDIVPFSRTAEIDKVVPSPDGRFLAVQVRQDWTPHDAWFGFEHCNEGRRRRSEVWLFDRTQRSWVALDERSRALDPDQDVWDAQGMLRTRSGDGLFLAFGWGEERIDPATGAVHLPDGLATEREWWSQTAKTKETVIWSWRGHKASLQLPTSVISLPSPQPGVVFHEQDGFLVRHDLATDSITRLAQLHEPLRSAPSLSPDGRYLLLLDGRDSTILDACDGLPIQRLDDVLQFRSWSRTPGRIAVLWTRPQRLALETDGTLAALPELAPQQLECGRDALVRFEKQRIELTSLDGKRREVIYEVRP